MSLFSRFFGKQPPAEGEAKGGSASDAPADPNAPLPDADTIAEKQRDSDPTIDTRFAHWTQGAQQGEMVPPVRSYEVQLPPGAIDSPDAPARESRPPVVELPARHVLDVTASRNDERPPPSQTAPAIVVTRVVSIEAGTKEVIGSSPPPAPLPKPKPAPNTSAAAFEPTQTYVVGDASPASSPFTSPVPRKKTTSGTSAAAALASANLPPQRAPQPAQHAMPPLEPFADTQEMTWDEREPSWDDSRPRLDLDDAPTPLVPEAQLMAPTPAVPHVSPQNPLPKMRAAAPTLLGTQEIEPLRPQKVAPAPRADLPPMRAAAATLVGTAELPKPNPPPAKAVDEEEEPAPITDRQANLGTGDLWKDDNFDDVLADVDAGFGAILERHASVPPPGSAVFDDARQLFVELAASHMRHVRDFMMDLASGPATADWIPLCIPATDSLRAGARAFELSDLVGALDDFLAALKAADTGAPSIEGTPRDKLLAAYATLSRAAPDAFAVDGARTEREGIIVKCLLAQVEDVRKVQQDKLFAAGLMSLEVLFSAKPRDIVDTTGISIEVATRVYERFLRYKRDTEGAAVDAERTAEWTKLKERNLELKGVHEGFENASRSSDSKKKKETRRQRELLVLDVKILLARLGQAEALAAVERAPFAEKISTVQKLIEKREQERVL